MKRWASVMAKTRYLISNLALLVILAWSSTAPDSISGSQISIGQIAFTSNRDGNLEIYLANTDGSGLTNLTNHPDFDSSPSWSPDGQQLAFVSNRDGVPAVYVMDVGTRAVRRVAQLDEATSSPMWSPTGDHIAFIVQIGSTERLEIYRVNPDGNDLIRLYSDSGYGGTLSWSPDGNRLIFDNNPTGNFELMFVDLSGNVSSYSPRSSEWDSPADSTEGWWDMTPNFSPTGDRIVFSSTRWQGQNDSFIAGLDGGNVLNLSVGIPYSFGPVFSPNGQWVAFMSSGVGLHVARSDGSSLVQVTELSSLDVAASWSWSPDSSFLALPTFAPGAESLDIFIVGTDGSSLFNLTDHPAEDSQPAWRPVIPAANRIQGVVTEVTTGEPIEDIAINIGSGGSILTDASGEFDINSLVDGTYVITANKIAYSFSPRFREIVLPPDAHNQDFVACSDLDEDRLCDSWETEGYDPDGEGPLFLNLPQMGADPNHKDIFVEVDYMEEVICEPVLLGQKCEIHSHRPNPAAIKQVVESFKNAPVDNPDSVSGIDLHVDFGPDTPMTPDNNWNERSGSNPLPHSQSISWDEFYRRKRTVEYFDPARTGIFHYAIFAHLLESSEGIPDCISGAASSAPGMDMLITLGGWGVGGATCAIDENYHGTGTESQQAGTFMHELGHNLGLLHGGGDDIIGKPNYLSVMNYAFQMNGLIFRDEIGRLDYSRSDRIPLLNESKLDESVGLAGSSSSEEYGTIWICPSREITRTMQANNQIDWNCDASVDEDPVSSNINDGWELKEPSPPDEQMLGYHDWAALTFLGGGFPGEDSGIAARPTNGELQELAFEQYRRFAPAYEVSLNSPAGLIAPVGASLTFPVTLSNIGTSDDRYLLSVNSLDGWVDLAALPAEIPLAAGNAQTIELPVHIPSDALVGNSDTLVVTAASHGQAGLRTSLHVSFTAAESTGVQLPSANESDMTPELTAETIAPASVPESDRPVKDSSDGSLPPPILILFIVGLVMILVGIIGLWRQGRGGEGHS